MILELIAAFIASLFFGLLFNIPPTILVSAGIIGSVGWGVYISVRGLSVVLGVFAAALLIGLISEILARYHKKPVTVFVIPGIVPLVPGAGAYYTMVAFMEGNFNLGMEKGAETLLSAGAIAAGVAFTGAFFRVIKERFK